MAAAAVLVSSVTGLYRRRHAIASTTIPIATSTGDPTAADKPVRRSLEGAVRQGRAAVTVGCRISGGDTGERWEGRRRVRGL